MTVKTVKGVEVQMVNDKQENCLYFPNPAKEETQMGKWNEMFGDAVAKIMRANYLSHAKNGYKDSNGNKVRNIRDLEGNIIREMELKAEDGGDKKTTQQVVQPAVSLADAVAVYKELTAIDNPALKKAIELQMTIIKSLINPALMSADIDTLQFIIDLKKEEAKKAEEQKEEVEEQKDII
jgi:hypothetical protein